MNACSLSLILLAIFFLPELEAKKLLHINKYEDCPEYPDLPIMSTPFKMHNYAKNNRTMEYGYVVKKEISGKLSGIVSLKKCDASGAPDTCEFFVKDMKFNEICTRMNEKGQAWTDSVEAFQPKMKCPIKPDTYKTEAPVSDAAFRFFPVPTGVWRAQWKLFQGTELILCQIMDAKVVDVKRN